MSEKKKDPGDLDYFSINMADLRVGEPLPFDCFGYLVLNQKYIQWSRKGDIFTASRKKILEKLNVPVVFGPTRQREEYQEYIKQGKAPPKESEPLVRHIFGAVNRRFADSHPNLGKVRREGPSIGAVSKQKGGNAKVNADFVNAIISSAQKVFQDQFAIPVKFVTAAKRTDATSSKQIIDIASFIVITSQSIRGTMGLCFPKNTYLFLLNQATDFDYREVSPEFCAGACEFLYPIFEEARPQLYELGYYVDRAVPTLVVGDDMSLAHVIPDNGFSVLFETPGGKFQLEIGIKTGA